MCVCVYASAKEKWKRDNERGECGRETREEERRMTEEVKTGVAGKSARRGREKGELGVCICVCGGNGNAASFVFYSGVVKG